MTILYHIVDGCQGGRCIYCIKLRRDEIISMGVGVAGHVAILQYAALAEAGFFLVEDLVHTKEIGPCLQGHPDVRKIPGIEAGRPQAICFIYHESAWGD